MSMADIKIRFEVNQNQETEKLGKVINDNAIVSNVSYKVNNNGEFNIVSSGENDGSNGLSFAQDLVFDAQGYLDNEDLLGAVLESEQEPTEFVWGVVPSSKEYSVKVTFSNATNLKDIVVFGDKTVGQYPTRAIIDGKTVVVNDDYKWAINLETESDTHTIEFTHWSRANYNACLTLIRVMFRYFEVGKRTGLKSVESLAQTTGQPKELYYGVIPSSGSVELIDVRGEFEDLLVDEVIPNSNLHLEVFANGRKIQNHLSVDSDYSSDKILTIELSNSLNNWDKIKFNGMKLRENYSLFDTLVYIFRSVGIIGKESEIYPMLTKKVFYEGIYVTIEEYLSNITIPYAYLEKSSLREAVDKVCSIAQLNVVENNAGAIEFISARPIIDEEKPIIKINPSQIKTTPSRDVLLKNKYKTINLDYNQIENTYKNFDTRQLTIYQENNNILDDKAYNPNITVIKSNIPWENNSSSVQYNYSIVKYDINFVDDLKIKDKFKYKLIDSWTRTINGETATSEGLETAKDVIYTYYDSDSKILSEWTNMSGDVPISIKTGVKNSDIFVKRNLNSTLTLYVLMLNNVINNSVNGVYHLHSLDFGIETITSSAFQTSETYDYSLSSSELMQNGTRVYNMLATDYLKSNILEDYSGGISTAEIEVICSDLYDVDGNKVKDWASGETYDIGDIVRVDKDKLGNSLWNYKDGTPMYWQVVSRNFKKAGVPIISLVLRECKYSTFTPMESVSFADDDWETINYFASNYRGQEVYNIGDEKTITLSTGEQVTLQVWGFNHDNLTAGGKANITIGMKNLLASKYQMNTTATNAGGWKDCYFRNTVLPQIFATLPSELQLAIKLVDKRCSYGDGTSSTYFTSDNLFLFSEVEVMQYPYYTKAVEGMSYKYWDNLNSNNKPVVTTKYLINGAGTSSAWWLRSPSDVNVATGSRFGAINAGGGYNSVTANSSNGICLGFCI